MSLYDLITLRQTNELRPKLFMEIRSVYISDSEKLYGVSRGSLKRLVAVVGITFLLSVILCVTMCKLNRNLLFS